MEHQGDILHLAATFQNILFETMSQEGEEAWEAMGTRKVIDSPSWTQVRNDLTGIYQQATITNELGQQEVMETMMIKLLMNRTAEEDERLQRFLSPSWIYSADTDTEA